MTPRYLRRFMSRFKVNDQGCWIWQSPPNTYGYGRLVVDGKSKYAHRLSYEHFVGPLASPEVAVCHTCDVRMCVNPAHLFAGSFADNVHDMVRKGRQDAGRGERHGNSRLTEEDVREVFSLRGLGWTQQAIADRLGCSRRLIGKILSRKAWAHLCL